MADSWMQIHEHELFFDLLNGDAPAPVRATCRCMQFDGPWRTNYDEARRDYTAHRAGRILPPLGAL